MKIPSTFPRTARRYLPLLTQNFQDCNVISRGSVLIREGVSSINGVPVNPALWYKSTKRPVNHVKRMKRLISSASSKNEANLRLNNYIRKFSKPLNP